MAWNLLICHRKLNIHKDKAKSLFQILQPEHHTKMLPGGNFGVASGYRYLEKNLIALCYTSDTLKMYYVSTAVFFAWVFVSHNYAVFLFKKISHWENLEIDIYLCQQTRKSSGIDFHGIDHWVTLFLQFITVLFECKIR